MLLGVNLGWSGRTKITFHSVCTIQEEESKSKNIPLVTKTIKNVAVKNACMDYRGELVRVYQ